MSDVCVPGWRHSPTYCITSLLLLYVSLRVNCKRHRTMCGGTYKLNQQKLNEKLHNINLCHLLVVHVAGCALFYLRHRQFASNMPNYNPCWHNGDSPERKVEVDASNLCHDLYRRNTIADGLPCRLGASKQRRVSNDLVVCRCQVLNDKVPRSIALLA